jgi:hypothetical protein
MKLPEWDDCKAAVDAGEATPIQEFIYNNEPAGDRDSRLFRKQLVLMLNQFCEGEWEK